MGSIAEKPANGFTYNHYLTWPEDERWEIINGEAYSMTPAPSIKHQEVSLFLSTLFAQFFKGKGCRTFCAPTDVVFDEQNVVQPDLLVVCDRSKITESNIKGAPDLIVEIISPSTAVKDKREKKALYERFGVREYLIVYPAEELVERFELADGRYGSEDVFAWEETFPLAVFPELRVSLREASDHQALVQNAVEA
ncbi:MAG TPA: Uma2 family endonuclease [Geobacter sp.]|nr:Uma2 family endonuclease [Geobacter sp.]